MDSSELEIIAKSHLTNYAILASVAFLLYDIVLKLDFEVDFVWKSRWTIAKWLYLITRYWGIVYNVSVFVVANMRSLPFNFCQGWFYYTILCGPSIFGASVYLILVLRVHALYPGRKVVIFLLSLWTIELAIAIYACVRIAEDLARSAPPTFSGLDIPGCSNLVIPRSYKWSLVCWIASLTMTLIFFPFPAFRLAQELRWRMKIPPAIRSQQPFLSDLMRSFFLDCFILYALIVAMLIVRIVMTLSVKRLSGYADLLDVWHTAVYSFTAPRLVLNLRHAAHRSGMSDVRTQSMTVQCMVFAREEHVESAIQLAMDSDSQVVRDHRAEGRV